MTAVEVNMSSLRDVCNFGVCVFYRHLAPLGHGVGVGCRLMKCCPCWMRVALDVRGVCRHVVPDEVWTLTLWRCGVYQHAASPGEGVDAGTMVQPVP